MLCLSFSYLDFQVKIDVSVKFQTAPMQAPMKLEMSQLDENSKTKVAIAIFVNAPKEQIRYKDNSPLIKSREFNFRSLNVMMLLRK